LIITMATQGPFQEIIEDFKSNFAFGKSTMWSSNSDWAQSDLQNYMSSAAENAPRFVAAFVDGCNALANEGEDVPNTDVINSILVKHESGYQVVGDTIVSTAEQSPSATNAEQSHDEKFSKPVRYSAPQPEVKKAKDAPVLRAFLCHSSGDKNAVRKLYKALSNDGFLPWLDEEDLIAGQDWDAEIKKAVRKSHVVIVCLSPTSTSGRAMALIGLRMMPTFPSPSLKFRTAGFPQYGFKASLSGATCRPAARRTESATTRPVPRRASRLSSPFARVHSRRETRH
jgi:hypothetical protein